MKDERTYGKKMARKGRTKVIYKGHSFPNSLYQEVHDNPKSLVNADFIYTNFTKTTFDESHCRISNFENSLFTQR